MKRILMFVVCAFAVLAVSACNKSNLKPYVVKSYTVVNDTVGLAKQSPSVITNNVPKLIAVGNVVKAALEFIGKKMGPEKVKPYIDAVDSVIAVLKTINDDPSKVTEKVAQVIAGLEKVRTGLVDIAKWVGCEGDLPTPKANEAFTIDQVVACSADLQKLIDKK